MKGRSSALIALSVAAMVVVLVVFVSRRDRNDGPPYAPESTASDGAKALIELLERFDVDVAIRSGMPAETDRVALMLEQPGGDREAREAAEQTLERFARAGGRVIIADPASGLTPEATTGFDGDTAQDRAACDRWQGDAPLPGVEELYGLTARYLVSEGHDGCFGRFGPGDRVVSAAVVRTPLGQGEIIAIGGPDAFTNQYLDEGDNAVLVTELMAGRGAVAFVRPGAPISGDKTLWQLLPGGVKVALAQLLVAFAIFVWASARRVGRPVREPLLWALPATAFAEGMGQLLQRAGRPQLAAAWLRRRTRRMLAGRYGLPAGVSSQEIAAAMAQDAGGRAAVLAALDSRTVHTAEDLQTLAADLDRLRSVERSAAPAGQRSTTSGEPPASADQLHEVAR